MLFLLFAFACYYFKDAIILQTRRADDSYHLSNSPCIKRRIFRRYSGRDVTFKYSLLMNIKELLNSPANVSLQVSVADLKEFALSIIAEVKAEAETKKEDVRLSTQEVADQLGKSTNCLWRWSKEGILSPSGYIGRNPFYWQSDVDAFLSRKGA